MTTGCKKEKLWFLDTFVTVHLSASSNTNNISVTEHRVPYGFSPPLHIHHTEDEVFHMLSARPASSSAARRSPSKPAIRWWARRAFRTHSS